VKLHDSTEPSSDRARDYGPPRLIVELANVCNLRCAYCLRDEEALYHAPVKFFGVELLRRVVREARETVGVSHVMFTGGEVTLHPRFREVIEAVRDAGLKCSFVTNGWHFERVWSAVSANRGAVTHVAFSLDGATREAHDRWRGEGSFVRLVRAFSLCRAAGLPFVVKVGMRRDTLPNLEQVALFAARMGASAASFSHLLPTSGELEGELALDPHERTEAEQEVATLASLLRMKVTLDVGYYNEDPAPPCSALAGVSCNVDYRGRLTLCCNLSGYRGAGAEPDVVADLNVEAFAPAYERLKQLAARQTARRGEALASRAAAGAGSGVYLSSPCLFCLKSFGKLPWLADGGGAANPLPVVPVRS
jgi:MoaA/NifB/PqqE/SkfB family radical SAM enzyme